MYKNYESKNAFLYVKVNMGIYFFGYMYLVFTYDIVRTHSKPVRIGVVTLKLEEKSDIAVTGHICGVVRNGRQKRSRCGQFS